MSFGFSVGDFIALVQLISSVRKSFADAPSEYSSICHQAKILDNVIQNLKQLNDKGAFTQEQSKSLASASTACKSVLEELEVFINKNSALRGGSAFRRTWQRLTINLDDVSKFESQLTSVTTLLVAVQTGIHSESMRIVRDGVDELRHKQNIRERDELMRWLAPSTFSQQQASNLQRRHPKYGEWLLDHEQFMDWSNYPGETLLCSGIPGSGKTVLSAKIIGRLISRFERKGDIEVVYFYFNFNRPDQQHLEDVLVSIARQLMQEQLPLPSHAEELLQAHRDRETRPSVDQLSLLVQRLVQPLDRLFIVLDALDECSNACKEQQSIIREISTLQKELKGKVSLLATTRIIPEILSQFPSARQIEIRAHQEDIERFVDAQIKQSFTNTIQSKPDLKQYIKEQIVHLSDGMFLLARLYLDSLSDKPTPKAIRKALADLPKGQPGLSMAYDDALSRIDQQQKGYRQLGQSVIAWISYAKRELTIQELQEAIASEPGMDRIDPEEDLADKDEMLRACAGLVILDPESGIVRLVHYTTQEYLTQVRERWIPEARLTIAKNCMAYLSMEEFKKGYCEDKDRFEVMMNKHKLLYYATKHWGDHVAESIEYPVVQDLCMNMLLDGEHLQFLHQALQAAPWSPSFLSAGMRSWFFGAVNGSPLHVAAWFHLRPIAQQLLQQGVDINSADSDGRTALHYSLIKEDIDFLTFLLDQPGVNANADEEDGYTILLDAARAGYLKTVAMLLARADAQSSKMTKDGSTIIACAAHLGHVGILQLLLAATMVDPDLADYKNRTPLYKAAEQGHVEVVKLLLTKAKSSVDAADIHGHTPLLLAARFGHIEILKLLLDTGHVNPFRRDAKGRTPRDWARMSDQFEVLKILPPPAD